MPFELFAYFTDPVLRAPMIGSILMSVAAALIGVLVFLKKESLLGEALSHASYPGLVMGVLLSGFLYGDVGENVFSALFLMGGALISSILGLKLIHFLETKAQVKQDAALCFVLSFFFGVGILAASRVQFSYSTLYKQVEVYFYGQSATMTDIHVWIFLTLALFVSGAFLLFKKEFELLVFDPEFAKSQGLPIAFLQAILLFLTALSIVIGIRSVGVILMSAMLIAPAASARQFSNSFSSICVLSVVFGILSAGLGTILSNESSIYLKAHFSDVRLTLPTGPLIVLIASFLCLLSLLFSPKRGAIFRLIRMWQFREVCLEENLLKAFYRHGEKLSMASEDLYGLFQTYRWRIHSKLRKLQKEGWLETTAEGHYLLTQDGVHKAAKIVRLHRLWELYLVEYVGVGKEKVHSSAEEMEHVLTNELERELDGLLKQPKYDPHHKPIPRGEA
jgi:manganese/zinc/iron transport system permease protein